MDRTERCRRASQREASDPRAGALRESRLVMPHQVHVLAVISVMLLLATGCKGATPEAAEASAFPALSPFDEATAIQLHTIREEVSAIRGLPINTGASEGWLARDVFAEWSRDAAKDTSEAERREAEAFTIAWRLMRMIAVDADLLEQAVDMISGGVLGLWLPDESALVLVGSGELNDGARITVAHEYVHSFQQAAFQAFDEARWEHLRGPEHRAELNTEYAVTIPCVYEGDAFIAALEYAQHAFGDRWLDAYLEAHAPEEEAPASSSLIGTSPALERYFSFNYSECARFVRYIYETGGWEAVNRLYERPPATTEQVLHPEKYEAAEPPTSLRPVDLFLGASWERLYQGAFGEFDVYNYLLTALTLDDAVERALEEAHALAESGRMTAEQAAMLRALDADALHQEASFAAAVAAEGWGAGWISVYRRPATAPGTDSRQEVFVHLSLEWDTDEDLWEFLTVYERVMNVKSGYSYEFVGESGPAQWHGTIEYGELSWDEAARRADILLATRRPILEAASSVLARSTAASASAQ